MEDSERLVHKAVAADSPAAEAVVSLAVVAVVADSPVAAAVVSLAAAVVGAATVAANRTAAAATGDNRSPDFFFPQEGPAVNQITPPGHFFELL